MKHYGYVLGARSIRTLGKIPVYKISQSDGVQITELARTTEGSPIRFWFKSVAERWLSETRDRRTYMLTGVCDHKHVNDTTRGMPCMPLLECRICGKFPVNLTDKPKTLPKTPPSALFEPIHKDQWIPTGIRWKMYEHEAWTYQEGLVHARIDGWKPYAYELVYTYPVKVQED